MQMREAKPAKNLLTDLRANLLSDHRVIRKNLEEKLYRLLERVRPVLVSDPFEIGIHQSEYLSPNMLLHCLDSKVHGLSMMTILLQQQGCFLISKREIAIFLRQASTLSKITYSHNEAYLMQCKLLILLMFSLYACS